MLPLTLCALSIVQAVPALPYDFSGFDPLPVVLESIEERPPELQQITQGLIGDAVERGEGPAARGMLGVVEAVGRYQRLIP
jgi:hypothetical protein